MGWAGIWESRELLLLGFWFTIILTVVTIITSTILGFVVALGRTARVPGLGLVLRGYLELFRGTPLLIQILFIYFGSAYLNLTGVTVFAAIVIAMTLYYGAYISEIFRAGFESVPYGQQEAGRSLGLSRFHVVRDVIVPQTVTIVRPPLVGQYISLVKGTALASVIGYADLVRQGQGIIDRIGSPFAVFLVVAALYFVISYPMSLVERHLEKRTVQA